MPPNEETALLPSVSIDEANEFNAALASGSAVSRLIFALQLGLVVFFLLFTEYSDQEFSTKEYIAFRDIMAMLLLGFGFLMTFLRNYGISAVGFTMLLTVLSMQLNLAVESVMTYVYEGGDKDFWPMPLTMAHLIDAEFCAATLLITFGALIGRASPLQMLVIAGCETIFYTFNKVFLVLGFVDAEDVGGSMTIHMFGAYFGLAVSYALGPPKDAHAAEDAEANNLSDLSAFIGTTILWVFWPSFVGATETGVLENEQRCVVSTVCALLASTVVAFWFSHFLTHSRFDPVHIANSTLAGGVAVGSSGRLNIGPGAAIMLGALAGGISVVGYVYSTPYLESKFKICDTCGVGNLHGWPSILGGLASVFFVTLDPTAEFLHYGLVEQMVRQLLGVVVTILVAVASGYGTGRLIVGLKHDATPSFLDRVWWHAEYFEEKEV